MKKILQQSGKALGYFLFYFVVGQLIFSVIIQIIMGIYAGTAAREAGVVLATQEDAQSYGMEFYAANMGIDLALRAILTLLCFLIFFLIRKKHFTEEISLQKTTGIKMISALFGAVFVIFFVNGMLNFLIPQDELSSFQEASSVLYAYPLWQALLANAFLVPILEEVVFRGLMFSRLQKALPNVATALITSLLFGLVHGQLVWMLFAFVVGLLLSYVRIKTGSILPTIVMHIMINLYATLSSYQIIVISNMSLYVVLVVIGALCIIPCVFLMHKACQEEDRLQAKVEVSTVVM